MILPTTDSHGNTILCLASQTGPSFKLSVSGRTITQQLGNYDVPLTNADAGASFVLFGNSDCH
ncbi:MAG: hypothetical protein ABI361_10290 [Nitrososphaera sp.]